MIGPGKGRLIRQLPSSRFFSIRAKWLDIRMQDYTCRKTLPALSSQEHTSTKINKLTSHNDIFIADTCIVKAS